MAAGSLHIKPADHNGWAVEVEGPTRFAIRYDLREDAVRAATEVARTTKAQLYIHCPDGQVRASDHGDNDGTHNVIPLRS